LGDKKKKNKEKKKKAILRKVGELRAEGALCVSQGSQERGRKSGRKGKG